MSFERMRLGEMLLSKKLITKEQLDTAHEYQKSLGGKLGGIVVKLGYMTDDALTREIARHYNMEVTDLANMILPVNLLKSVPRAIIEKHNVIPVHVTNDVLTVAMSDPTDYEALDELQFVTGKKIETTLTTRDAVKRAITEFLSALDKEESSHGRGPTSGIRQAGSAGKLRPASKGSLSALREATESAMVDDLKGRLSGQGVKVNTQTLTRAELRSAVIPLLIKKGVINEGDLFDSVIELLKRKGVIDPRELSDKAKELGGR
jgi:type IV pilus assembly protein PilB